MAIPQQGRIWKALAAALCLPGAGWLAAADNDPFATPKSLGGSQNSGAQSREPVLHSTSADAVLRPGRERQLLRVARQSSAEILQSGENAFHRGLLPLRDYLEQTALVTEVDIQSAQANAAPAAPAWQQQVDRLRAIRDRLEPSRQPGHRGWAADAALAEWALADAEVNLAAALGDVVTGQEASARRHYWASEHYHRRKGDADVGAASLAEMSQAALLVVASRSGVEHARPRAEYTSLLQRIVDRTQEWSEKGAGVGREDRLLEARIAEELDRLTSADDDGELKVDAEVLESADRALRELFEKQIDYHRHGTAGLYDLARTWTTWRDLHQTGDANEILSAKQSDDRKSALATLQRLAEDQSDHSGRFAADLAYVDLLGQLDAVDSLRSESSATGREYAQ